ncbi:MAG TPA: thioredoxin family protein [Chitinophagaceae bacterium]
MKLFPLAIAFSMLFSVGAKAQSSARSASELLKEAYQSAAANNKNVFIMFHASWCGWCHKMDKSMNDETCKKFFEDNFVICHLVVDESADKKNLENPGADEFRKKYYGDGQGIPFWLVFDKEGILLADSKMRDEGAGPETGENTGCPASEKEVEYFISVLQKTTKLNPAALEVIRKRFRQNEQ